MVTQVSNLVQKKDISDDVLNIDKIFKKAQKYKKELNLELSLKYFSEVLSLDPQHGWAHHCIAQTHHWRGELDKSVDHYNQAIDCLSFKTSAVSLQQLAYVYKAQNKTYHAYITINEASIRDPDREQYKSDKNILLSELANSIAYLFDEEFYANKIIEITNIRKAFNNKKECAKHYLESGWKHFPAGNWLFSVEYIEKQLKNSDTNIPLLIKYSNAIKNGLNINPSPMFDVRLVKDTLKEQNVSMYLENIISDKDTELKYSYLFDASYYKNQFNNLSDEWVQCNNNPYKHYLLHGYLTDANPHRLFNTKYYRTQLKNIHDDSKLNKNLLYYYFEHSVIDDASPCAVIPTAYYKNQFPETMENDCYDPILVHFLKSSNREGSIPDFNAEFYLETNIDIHGQCPYKHFAEYGIYESERAPFRGLSKNFIFNRSPVKEYKDETPAFKYYSSEMFKNETILLVSHSGSRTGAPLIILKIAKELCKIREINLITVVIGGGELVKEFGRYSHVVVTKDKFGGDKQENSTLQSEIIRNGISVIIANSAESHKFLDSTYFKGKPTFMLIHEIADHYPRDVWKNMFDTTNHIVFPSKYVSQKSLAKLAGTVSKHTHIESTSVIPQGLLTDNFGLSKYNINRKYIRKELRISDNAVVVLGCGVMDFRKGIDLFFDTAKQTIASNNNVIFLWLGGNSNQSDNDDLLYWKKKVTSKGILENIKFVNAVSDPEPYFQASDIFLLTSRSDPFPCVVHEAMSCKLPIVYMNEATGSEELIGSEFGIPVTYEDVGQLSNAVIELASNNELRISIGDSAQNYVRKHCRYPSYVYNLINKFCEYEGVSSKTASVLKKYQKYSKKNEKDSVYFLSPDWGLSGVNSISEVLIDELIKSGYDAKILFTRHQLDFSHSENVFMPKVPYEFLNTNSEKDFPENVWDSLLEYFAEHDPCVVVFNYDYISSSVSALFPEHVALIGVAHSDDAEHYEHVNRVGRYWNHIVGVSDEITDGIRTLNQSLDRVTSIRNGISDCNINNSEGSTSNRKAKEKINLVYSGRMVDSQKKVKRYIDLASELNKRDIDFHLNMLGDGSELDLLKTEIDSRGLFENVSLLGRVSNEVSIEYFRNSDVFLLLSDFEGLPISLLEALREGCIPIVYNMNSGVNDVIEHGLNGYVCQTNKIVNVADYIEKIFHSNNNEEMIANCKNSLKNKKLTSVDMSDKYVEIFRDCLKEIENNNYVRPKSLEHGYWYKGAMPPAWIKKETIS